MRRTALAVAALALVALVATMSRALNVYDESIPLVGAMRVAAGELPHRDFYSIYGPAPYYVLAGLFRIFGPTLIVERLYDAVIKAAIVGLVYLLTARNARAGLAALASTCVAVWFVSIGAYGYGIFPVLLLGILSTTALAPVDGPHFQPRGVWTAGALTGAAALFRYDTAGFILAAHALAVTLTVFTDRSERPPVKVLWGVAWRYGAACGLVFTPVALAFVMAGALPGFLFDIFGFTARTYQAMRGLPWPRPADLIANPYLFAVYLPIFPLTALAISWVLQARSGTRAPTQPFLIALSLLTAAFILKGAVRPSLPHMLMAIVTSTIILVTLADHALRSRWLALRLLGVSTLTLIAALTLVALPTYPGLPLILPSPAPMQSLPVALRPGLMRRPFVQAANLVIAMTRPGERIFVGRFHHDRYVYNAVGLYFATQRLPATRWHHFDPGLQTSAVIQREIAGELEAHRTRVIVLENDGDELREPNASAISSGVHLLDDYIAGHYVKVQDFGVVQVWRRRL